MARDRTRAQAATRTGERRAMKVRRLLLVTDAVGGVWVYSLELARALRPLGIETLLAVMGPPATASQRDEAADVELIDTGLPRSEERRVGKERRSRRSQEQEKEEELGRRNKWIDEHMQ